MRPPYRKVEDPRSNFWVAEGIWPDCPDCYGLAAANRGPSEPPLFVAPGDTRWDNPQEVPFPCPTCQNRCQAAGIELPKHYWERGPITPWGTWPDCPSCKGGGGHRYESSWDGHRSDYDWATCPDCQKRTRAYLLDHPTDLDNVLALQRSQITDLLTSRADAVNKIKQIDTQLQDLCKAHEQEIKPYQEQLAAQRTATPVSN